MMKQLYTTHKKTIVIFSVYSIVAFLLYISYYNDNTTKRVLLCHLRLVGKWFSSYESYELAAAGGDDDDMSSTKRKVLNIHIVPHTHDDVGWLKTVEQYYYGLNSTIQNACVSCILDTVIHELQINPNRKFTYVEMAFFSMWWDDQSTYTKDIVRELVRNKQLSFVNGGWCMHDEATTHFIGMIDQTSLGHEFLKRELGYIPRVAWQLDPFGHSATQASLLGSEAGFDAIYFGRIDYQDLTRRHETKNCEGIWDASSNLDNTAIFWGLTGSYLGNYGAPPGGFCFDVQCHDQPLVGLDNDRLYQRVLDFMNDIKVQLSRTRGDNLMLTMGSDFQYSEASVNFENLDLLIATINGLQLNFTSTLFPEYDEINAFYSSPEMYTDYKYGEFLSKKDSVMNFETKYDDFFPYSDCEHCFWTGYFTSRPALKRLERVGSAFLQVARQVQSYFDDNDGFQQIYALEKAMGVVQHHDGVSGTSKQHVAYDYAKKLQFGINEAATFVSDVIKAQFSQQDLTKVAYCQMRNESICELAQAATTKIDFDPFYLVLYNSLAHVKSEIVSLPVSSNSTYVVEKALYVNDSVGSQEIWEVVQCSLFPSVQHHKRKNGAPFALMFDSGPVHPISMTLFRISNSNSNSSPEDSLTQYERRLVKEYVSVEYKNDFSIKKGKVELHFRNGNMEGISNNDMKFSWRHQWGYYKSFPGTATDEQASGAYIFRPDIPDADFESLSPIKTMVVESSLLTEVHVEYEVPWIKEVIVMQQDKEFIDFKYTVGPIDISDGVGKEIVSRFETKIKNRGRFYTDSNGREFMERKRSSRNTWKLEEFEPISGNYYPVNAAIYIEDEDTSLALLTDRTQGGSSLYDGVIEVMVHRRTVSDDRRGVSEPLNETDTGIMPYPPYGDASRQGDGIVITGKHRVFIGSGKCGALLARDQMDEMFSPLQVFAATSLTKTSSFSSLRTPSISALLKPLPKNLQLTTMKLLHVRDGINTFLIRLSHLYGKGESISLSEPASVDLSEVLINFDIINILETTLSGNRDREEWFHNKMNWSSIRNSREFLKYEKGGNLTIVVHPMEIRTFRVEAKRII